MFYKIWKFKSSTTTNDVITEKQWQNSDIFETKQIVYHLKGIDESNPKNVLFIESEPLCEKLWAFLSILGLFMMPAHQIWPCYVTQEANFEIFSFCSNSVLNIGRSHETSNGEHQ